MNYILDIVSRFIPVGMNTAQTDLFVAFGSAIFIAFIIFLAYKIVRIFL